MNIFKQSMISEDILLHSPFDIHFSDFWKKYTFQFHGKKGGQSVVCIYISGISLSYYFFTTYFKFNKKCI